MYVFACCKRAESAHGGWLQGIKVYEWEAFNKMGKSKPLEAVPPKPEDPATIMYTSGTTGLYSHPCTSMLNWHELCC